MRTWSRVWVHEGHRAPQCAHPASARQQDMPNIKKGTVDFLKRVRISRTGGSGRGYLGHWLACNASAAREHEMDRRAERLQLILEPAMADTLMISSPALSAARRLKVGN